MRISSAELKKGPLVLLAMLSSFGAVRATEQTNIETGLILAMTSSLGAVRATEQTNIETGLTLMMTSSLGAVPATEQTNTETGLTLMMTSSLGAVRATEQTDILENKFTSRFVVQSYAQTHSIANSNDNPNNLIAKLAERNLTLELRPEFRFTSGLLDLQVSPRARTQWNQVTNASVMRRDSDNEAYVNGWGARFMPNDAIALSIGREVLLWGAAMSYSPSNPFYTDNGRNNPNIDLDGKDFAKAIWFPSKGLTLSYIDNFGKGRSAPPALELFRRTRVLKLDYTGDQAYWSVNYAWIENSPNKIGFLFQTTLSDAWLAYVEGGYSLHRTQYRPMPNASVGWEFVAPNGGGPSGLGVLGMTYTLQSGPTLTFEYIHNNQGWNADEANAYQSLAQNAVSQLGGTNAGFALQQLARGSQPGSILLRRNYLFIQYFHQNLAQELDLTVRLTRGLDDNSMRLGTILEERIGNRYSVFGQTLFDTGGTKTEFGRYINRQFLLGVRANF